MKTLNKFRMWQWALLAACFATVLYIIAPQQLGLLALKGTYIAVAAFAGYYLDRCLFPYARPHLAASECNRERRGHTSKIERIESAYRAYHANMLRRAIIVGSTMIAFAIGI